MHVNVNHTVVLAGSVITRSYIPVNKHILFNNIVIELTYPLTIF